MTKRLNIAIIAIILSFATSCSSKKNTGSKHHQNRPTQNRMGQNGQRPNLNSIFTMLDSNRDGKINKREAQNAKRGPLKTNFSSIDVNNDGFVTKVELNNYKPTKR